MRSFVGGEENRLVETALQSLYVIRQEDGDWQYNPLVLSGGSGTGKSLLAECFAGLWSQAVTTRPVTSQPDLNSPRSWHSRPVFVTTGADWARDYAHAVKDDQVDLWRSQIRQVSLLVIDDIHQLAKRNAAQRELIWLIDSLLDNQVPMVFTSPCPPAMLEQVDARLISRLSGGLYVDLQPPDVPARLAILQQLSAKQPRPLTDDALAWFAESYRGTVPALQNVLFGALARANAGSGNSPQESALSDCAITKPELKRLISSWSSQQSVTLHRIARTVSRYTQISQKQLHSSVRRQSVVQARCLAMYLAKEIGGYSLREIGHFFGGRDHSTVLHACRKIHEQTKKDPLTRIAVEELVRILVNERSKLPD